MTCVLYPYTYVRMYIMSVTYDGQWQFSLVCFISCFCFSILLFRFAFHFSGLLNCTKPPLPKKVPPYKLLRRVCIAVKLVLIPFSLSSNIINFILLKKCAFFMFLIFVWGLCDKIRLVQTPLIAICTRINTILLSYTN